MAETRLVEIWVRQFVHEMPGSRIPVALPIPVRPGGFRSYVASCEIVSIGSKQRVHLLQDLGIKVSLSDESNDFGAKVALALAGTGACFGSAPVGLDALTHQRREHATHFSRGPIGGRQQARLSFR